LRSEFLKTVNNFIEILWFFNKEIDITNGWEDLEPSFKNKFSNIFYVIKTFKNKISKFPIKNKKNYMKNITLF